LLIAAFALGAAMVSAGISARVGLARPDAKSATAPRVAEPLLAWRAWAP